MKRWFAAARGWDDLDPVHFEWTTSPEEAARLSAFRRGETSPLGTPSLAAWPAGRTPPSGAGWANPARNAVRCAPIGQILYDLRRAEGRDKY